MLDKTPVARDELLTKSKLIVVPAGSASAGIETATELFELAPEKVFELPLEVITEPIRLSESVIPYKEF